MLEEGAVIKVCVALAAPFRLFAAAWRSLRYRLQGRPVVVPANERIRRQAICAYCRHNHKEMCSLCACFISAKVLLSAEQCPDNPPRWLKLQ